MLRRFRPQLLEGEITVRRIADERPDRPDLRPEPPRQ
jgi:hypothetical protein